MKITEKQRSIFLSAILVAVALGGTAYGSYQRGYKIGQKDEAAKHTASQSLENTFNNASSFFHRSTTGTLTKIDGKQLTIKPASGTEQTVTLTDKTTYSKSGKAASAKDLKKDQKITILLSETDRSQAARVTIK